MGEIKKNISHQYDKSIYDNGNETELKPGKTTWKNMKIQIFKVPEDSATFPQQSSFFRICINW